MNMTVGDLQFNFVAGTLTLKYASVTFNAGEWPNNINGSLQVTPDDGISLTSTEDEIKAAAKTKIQALINADDAPA
ncbi:hypothetical protein D0499_05310 [Weissella soli]|uniref:hypothetical protein n=1 Tax=Weissella soli TaxID=155866 RepID=UPI0021BE6589|nr:hypothetical protein [Weissella soli]MCT8395228.1 hypothetical protein [Weissella soli]